MNVGSAKGRSAKGRLRWIEREMEETIFEHLMRTIFLVSYFWLEQFEL